MKTTSAKHLSVIFLLTGILIFLSSCNKKNVNEVIVPDFAALAGQFKAPPAEYSTAPFFVWNAEITEEEIDNFLTEFKEAGSLQVFIHPRPGLITEYLSDEWFRLYKYAVEKGKELGMKVWIYDENSYPSGFAGGHVPDQMPESFNQGQGLRMTKFEVLPDTAGKYFLCLKEDNGTFTDITASLANEYGKTGKYLLFSKAYFEKSDWHGGFSYVDLLYKGVTEKFIDITMTGYEKHLGTEFGKTIPGTFTDEPEINSPGGIRWTPDLFDVFMEEWHYDLKTNLPSLYEEVGDWKKVRHNYTSTLLQMFIDRWAKPWYEWCEEKGMKFTGHYWEHEWPNMRPGGDNMAMYAWHQVPAIDMLFNQWNDSTSKAQFGNIRAIKELASAANQTGRQRKLSETYGGSGWDLTFTDMKRNGDWEYALGVNLMNQHLTYFTLSGARKYDYPPSFDYHEPWWKDYKFINDHYARLSLALSSGRQINDILIIEPTTSAWLYDSYTRRNPKNGEIGQAFQTFITKLEKNQVEYDLGSENMIKDLGTVSKGKFVIGQASYTKVIIPPLTENIDLETYKLLEKFVVNGGTLIAFSIPSLVNGAPSEGLKEFLSKYSEKIIKPDLLSPEIISEFFASKDPLFDGRDGGMLYHQTRKLADGKLIFLVNSDLDEQLTGSLTSAGSDVVELNTLTGSINGYPNDSGDGKVTLSYAIPPAGSLLLFVPESKNSDYQIPAKYDNKFPVNTDAPLVITRDQENALMIDFCDIEIGNELTRDIHTINAADKVYKYHGFKNGNPWNTSVQFRTSILDRDKFEANTGLTATYHFITKGNFDKSGLKAVIERPNLWSVSINGTAIMPETGKWWLDRSFGVFNIGDYAREGDNIIVLHTSPMKIHAEVEPVYIVGDFSVIPASKGWVIEPPVANPTTLSWLDQGLPFYSWGITYSREFNVENTSGIWQVELGKWNGTVAEVNVNGKKAPLIAFPPYVSDVTGLITTGVNKIEIKVIGSLKNLLGPHHNYVRPGLASPGSWKNVKTYPSGSDYDMISYGLYEAFTLYNEK